MRWSTVNGGSGEMGTNGAALASGFSFTAAAIVLLGLWYGKRLIVGVGGKGSFTLRRISQLYQIGYPAAIEQFVFQIGFVGFLWLVAQYGTAPYAAYGIGVQILSVSFVVGLGSQSREQRSLVNISGLVTQELGVRAGAQRGSLYSA